MILVYLAFGLLVGATAGTLILLSGSSLLLASAAYSCTGSLAAIGLVLFTFLSMEDETEASKWQDKKKTNPVVA